MKALVLTEYNHFEYQDVDDPEIGPEEVLVQVRACGICGSDVHGMDGSSGRRRPPIIMGHEASGVIAQLGPAVTGWEEGDQVTFDSTVYCGRCWFCRRGEINLCDDRRVLGVSCEEYRRHGAFAEYVAVPQHILYRLPEFVAFETASMVEPLSIAFHAVHRTRVRLADTAVVVGAGVIGLLVIQTLRAAGCGKIIAVDLSGSRLLLAQDLGVEVTLKADKADVVAEVFKHTAGRGADIAVEAVGLPETFHMAVQCVRKGGQVTLVGNVSPSVEMGLQAVVTRELTLNGSCASRGDYPACLDMIARGAVDPDPLISALAPLAEGAEWFARMYRGEKRLIKVILKP